VLNYKTIKKYMHPCIYSIVVCNAVEIVGYDNVG